MTFSSTAAVARRSLVLLVLLVMAGGGCAPPDPLAPDCRCGGDGGFCPESDVQETWSDIIPGDSVESELGADGDGVDVLEVDMLEDGGELLCSGEPGCPESGVCAGMVAHCVKGDWVCDFGALVDFELGGETLCDGKDNDCDGTVDDVLPVHSECKVAGVCAAAEVECVAGQWDCGLAGLEDYEAGKETFHDGLDNNCDGTVDEDLTKACSAGQQ